MMTERNCLIWHLIGVNTGMTDKLPLACPLKEKFRISSTYGGRIHPLTKKRSFHSGIDMAVELAAPVYATASGTVTFAGKKGGYGRCVVIRHSYGFETLYAHLAAYYTTKGKKTRERGCNRLCREYGKKYRLSPTL